MAALLLVPVAALAVLALVAAGGYWAIFRRPLPRTVGRLAVAGLVAEVEITRGDDAVPHVRAGSERDAAYAVGFLHGQERLWQLELLRRIAAGRVSEVVGERGLPVDRLMRRLGLRRVSEAEWHVTHAAGDLRRLLLAYTAGVNAAMADRPLPAEMTILRHRPEPWTPEDSLAIGRLLGFSQARGWEAQLVRMRLVAATGMATAAGLDPTLGGASAEAALGGLVADLAAVDAILPLSAWTAASNSWAVSGARTAGGRPLLANDPHSALTMPSLWYQVHLTHPDNELSGFSACGLPFVLCGHNRDIAWGLANSGLSLQDLYVERFNPNNPLQFDDGPGGWQDAVRFREVIRVRGGGPVTEDVLVTRRGPIVSPALPGKQPPLSLRWVSLDSEIDSLGWLMRLNRAGGWPAFRAAIASCPSPALAVTYADSANVGWRVSGFIPRRPAGRGRLPSAGWDGGAEWEGFLGLDEVPEALNPDDGVVVCANQPLDGAADLPGEPLPAHRAERIRELIGDRRDLTVEDMAAIQLDVTSPPARRLRALVLRHLDGTDGGDPVALALLRDWDCRVAAGSGAALLYERLMERLRAEVMTAVGLDGALAEQLAGGAVHPVLPAGPHLSLGLPPVLDLLESGRVTPGAIPDGAAVAGLLAGALRTSVAELSARYGADPRRWRWGDEQRLAFSHPLGAAFGALAPIVSRGPISVDGDLDTVKLAGRGPASTLLPGTYGPVFRAVYAPGDWAASQAGFVPGQSGHPGSPRYADLIDAWRAGRLRPLPWGAPPAGRALRLIPSGANPALDG